jgi:hypothetical protein
MGAINLIKSYRTLQEIQNMHKRKQLRELAEMNGTCVHYRAWICNCIYVALKLGPLHTMAIQVKRL